MDRRRADLPATVYLGLVIVPLVAQIGVRLLDPSLEVYGSIFNGEMGFIELGTAALLLAASILLARESWRLIRCSEYANAALLGFLAFGAFLYLGEEISWGQWFFRWSSPEWFLQYNAQGETNLHNLDFVKKDIPKWVVVLGIAIFGILLPLRGTERHRIGPFDAKLLPTRVCLPVALVVVVSHLAVKLWWWSTGISEEDLLGIDVREATEFYIGLFGLLYALSLRVRLRSSGAASSSARDFGVSTGGPSNGGSR